MSKFVAGTSDQDKQNSIAAEEVGTFVRGISTCRNWIGGKDYPAEPNRYHLIIGYNCPWCHRVALARSVLGLKDSITMDVCFPSRTDEPDSQERTGLWQYAPDGHQCRNGRFITFPECTADTIAGGVKTAVEIYDAAGVQQKSVPILFDKKTNMIVSNESADIVRMLSNHATALGSNMSDAASPPPNLYPEPLQAAIDDANEWIYHSINNGAYRAGFASTQDAYEAAYYKYFEAIDRLELLFSNSGNKFVCGDVVTEADIRLFPTLFRHDPVYHNRFKLNRSFLRTDCPAVFRWLRRMCREVPGVKEESSPSILQMCKQGYFGRTGNNTIPLGPVGYPSATMIKQLPARAVVKTALRIVANYCHLREYFQYKYKLRVLRFCSSCSENARYLKGKIQNIV